MIIKLNEHNLVHEIAALGVHPASVGIFASKSRIIPLKITAVRTPAANILKQEMLAAGGDCAVPGWQRCKRNCKLFLPGSSL